MPAFVSLNGIPAAVRGAIFHARFRELLVWCLPALVLGAVARGWVLFHYPYGTVHPDSADFLITADTLLRRHHFVLHGKKAFLAPVLYALPLLCRLPTLLVIPWAQHLTGLIFTLMIGELVRLWTRLWKAWIIPATILATLNPAMVWYEHTLISEFQYLWCATALVLAGTACALWPGKWRFAMLLGALLLTAGSRPEGKLYVLFCVVLVGLIPWGTWKTRLIYGAVALAFCLGTWMSSRNTQAGLLLYATVLPLAPEVPRSAPGFATWIDPLRKERVAAGALVPNQLTTAEKTITPLVLGYLKSIDDRRTTYGQFCQRLAVEAALNRPLLLPVIAFNKFLVATVYPASGDFSAFWMQDKQVEACTYKEWMARLMPRLVGERLTSQPDVAAADRGEGKNSEEFGRLKQAVVSFVQQEYVPLGNGSAFGMLQNVWMGMTTGARVGEQHYGDRTVPGVPLFFILAAAGMVASICRAGPLRKMHIAWVMTLGFLFMVVMLTGVMNSRYRFVFEPFCLLYIFTLLDFVASLLTRWKPNHERTA
jgi:hypothetical protein